MSPLAPLFPVLLLLRLLLVIPFLIQIFILLLLPLINTSKIKIKMRMKMMNRIKIKSRISLPMADCQSCRLPIPDRRLSPCRRVSVSPLQLSTRSPTPDPRHTRSSSVPLLLRSSRLLTHVVPAGYAPDRFTRAPPDWNVHTMPQWNPSDYRQNSSVQQAWARELIDKLQLQPTEHLLDIGCGDGKVTAEIAGLLPAGHVVGVDSSAEMIRFARLEFPTARCANLRFEVADARRLAFEAQFDVVFSNAALHWIVGHACVLEGISRALRPGGRILLQMGGRGNAAAILAVLDDMLATEKWHSTFGEDFAFPYGFYGPDDYAPWLADAGLVARRVQLIGKDMVHAGTQGLAGWIRTTWLPYTERVPAERRDAFVAEIIDRYLARRPLDADGNVHLEMVRLEVEAHKPR